MTDKASRPQVAETIRHLEAIDKAIQATPEAFTEWEMDFAEEHVSRSERFGENTFFSARQCETIARLHKEKVLGEKPDKKPPVRTRYDRSRAAGGAKCPGTEAEPD